MRLLFGVVLWVCFCMYLGVMFNGCASQGKQETWQSCAAKGHVECWDRPDPLVCEYDYYKVCIGE